MGGFSFSLSEGESLPSGAGVSAGGVSSKASASIFRLSHCGLFTAAQVVLYLADLPTFGPSLSRAPPPRQ